jgi:WhiB family redox-sensing transcriptional regulator
MKPAPHRVKRNVITGTLAGVVRKKPYQARAWPKVTAQPGDLDWQDRAACIGHDPDLWADGLSSRRRAQAIAICNGCPVKAECLEFALEQHAKTGIWGGLTALERIEHKRQRSRREAR